MPRTCAYCGKALPDGTAGSYCSKDCRFNHLGRARKCDICGREFTGLPKAKHCPDCRAIARREYNRKRAEKEGYKKTEARKTPAKKRVPQLDERCRRAREMGLSYGKYVALVRMGKVQDVLDK